MALMTPEPFCTAELWTLLELLPYRVRFEVYDAAQVRTSHNRIGTYRNPGKVLSSVGAAGEEEWKALCLDAASAGDSCDTLWRLSPLGPMSCPL